MRCRRHLSNALLCAVLAACSGGGEPARQAETARDFGSAATQKVVERARLEHRWDSLAVALPTAASAIRVRIDELQASPDGRNRATELAAARISLGEAAATWSKGQAAFATGNLKEAVAIGERLEQRYAALAGSLQVQPPAAPGAGASP